MQVVLQVGGGGFVEEPEVDVIGAEGGEAAGEGLSGFGGSECGAGVVSGGGVGGSGDTFFEAGDFFQDGAGELAADGDQGSFFCGEHAVLGGDGDLARMALEEFAEAALGFAVAVHGSDVEVADAGVVGGLEEFERVAAA